VENDWVRDNPIFRDAKQKNWLRTLIMWYYAPNEKAIMELVLKLTRRLPRNRVGELLARGAAWLADELLTFNVVMTRGELFDFINSLPDDFKITLGNCPCKELTQSDEKLDGRLPGETDFSCTCPLDTDVQIGSASRFYEQKVPTFKFITKDQLIEHENKLLDLGLVPNVYLVCLGESAICNCSPKTCIPFIANREVGAYRLKNIRQGKYVAKRREGLCKGCGECLSLAVCPFEARQLIETKDNKYSDIKSKDRCFGCGKCSEHCSQQAIEMVLR
jgi:Pyruvate/2-oxoacid:ferredoxin oxidoreductase delta subunit